jgi:Spy/CpxP family protein refolding chaperone
MKYQFHSSKWLARTAAGTGPSGVSQTLVALLMAFAIITTSYSGLAQADRRHGNSHHSGHNSGLISSGILPRHWTRRLRLDDTQVTAINGIIQEQQQALQSLQEQIKQLRGELWVIVQNGVVADPTDPVDDTTDPVDDGTDPADDSTDPADDSTDPVDDSTDPVDYSTDPVTSDVDMLAVEIAELVKQVIVIKTDIRTRIYQLLTPEQQAKLDELIERRFGDLPTDGSGSDDDGMADDGTDDDGSGDDGMVDDGCGDQVSGDDGAGDDSAGDDCAGDDGAGDDSAGDDSAGDDDSADQGTGDPV